METEYQKNIHKIMIQCGCTEDIAIKAMQKSFGNVKEAMIIAKSLTSNELYVGGGSSGLAVEGHDPSLKQETKKIYLYKNGLKINNIFYDFKERKNLELKKMLERHEFDPEIFGGKENEQVQVALVDMSFKEYTGEEPKSNESNQPKRRDWEGGRKLSDKVIEDIKTPDEIIIDSGGNIMFKILFPRKRVKVIVNEGKKVGDVIKYIKDNYVRTADIYFTSNNVRVGEDKDISYLKNTLVVLGQE